jgi:hypothetical protein
LKRYFLSIYLRGFTNGYAIEIHVQNVGVEIVYGLYCKKRLCSVSVGSCGTKPGNENTCEINSVSRMFSFI